MTMRDVSIRMSDTEEDTRKRYSKRSQVHVGVHPASCVGTRVSVIEAHSILT